MIPEGIIERAAHAVLHADHPEASGWSGKPVEVRERYRRLARAALESAEPHEDIEGFVGVTCEAEDCFMGGYFPAGGWTPVDDDGREFEHVDRRWLCPVHAEAARDQDEPEETP